jgi:hypothetical protein
MELLGRSGGIVEDLQFTWERAQLIRQKIRGTASSLAEDNPQPIKSPSEHTLKNWQISNEASNSKFMYRVS